VRVVLIVVAAIVVFDALLIGWMVLSEAVAEWRARRAVRAQVRAYSEWVRSL
jgi:hypothetical protein